MHRGCIRLGEHPKSSHGNRDKASFGICKCLADNTDAWHTTRTAEGGRELSVPDLFLPWCPYVYVYQYSWLCFCPSFVFSAGDYWPWTSFFLMARISFFLLPDLFCPSLSFIPSRLILLITHFHSLLPAASAEL